MIFALAGAIFGLGGALAVYYLRHKEVSSRGAMLQSLGSMLAINMGIGLAFPRLIDNWCAFHFCTL
jgi:hypothetical protein